ncbi:hypothetical protein ACFQ8S_02150 [Streptomyces virginiae]|uniref:hypothetical protein n=1 Tax=Streptomyces virginiae TaxID=1961 RepID=UPI0036BA9D3A
MPAEQLEEAITYAAAEVGDGTVEHAELAGRIDVPTTSPRSASHPGQLGHRRPPGTPALYPRLVELPTGHPPMLGLPDERARRLRRTTPSPGRGPGLGVWGLPASAYLKVTSEQE